jgi:hypothetical protein
MSKAVTQAQEGVERLGTPSAVEDMGEGLQNSDLAIQTDASFSDTWGPVLEKLEFIQKIDDNLSEVSQSCNL